MPIQAIDPQSWKAILPEFQKQTEAFHAGSLSRAAYKGFSGFYGSYAQRDGTKSMLRLRMTAGRVTAKKLAFVAAAIRRYAVSRVHFTTCQSIQLHDLPPEALYAIMEQALDVGIVTMGGGGDFPRNVMCSPLSGVEPGECFDVLPWAEAAGEYLMQFIQAEKMPRKLKVCFSNSPQNTTHATFRDLGFAARPDGRFDVYSAGGLGNNPRFGVRVAEAISPEDICSYIRAMWLTFRAHGNYENRGKARTRYMQEALGGRENYLAAFREKLTEVLADGSAPKLHCAAPAVTKAGNGSCPPHPRVLAQKQPGLYAVSWHPIGGDVDPALLCALADAIGEMEAAELRLRPDEGAYIINLTAGEAQRILELTKTGAETPFEASVACIGSRICQVGLQDSQQLLRDCIAAVQAAQIPGSALPQLHISGCPSSCGTHQIGQLGFRGASKSVDGRSVPAFSLFVNGCDVQGQERMGQELGAIAAAQIPEFLVTLGQAVAATGLDFAQWLAQHPDGVAALAQSYLA